MAETLSLISTIAFAAAAVCLVVTGILFIRFKIPSVIGDLSGRNARRSIEQMREMNEKSGSKAHRSSKVNMKRGKLTETMQGARKAAGIRKHAAKRPETELLDENRVKGIREEETALLQDVDATELLQDDYATALLDTDQEFPDRGSGGIVIEVLEEVMIIHSGEVIG